MIPTPILAHSPNIISIGSAVFAQITTECPYTLQWDDLNPHLIHGTLDAPEFRTQMSSQSVYLFLYRLAQSVPKLDTGMPLPPQNCSFLWRKSSFKISSSVQYVRSLHLMTPLL